MKKYLFFLLILFCLVNCKEPQSPAAMEIPDDQIVIGKKDSVFSNILNESRKIWVHVPKGAKDKKLSKLKYPVLYLLDGPQHFESITGMMKQLSPAKGNTVVPEMIVIGIENTDRSRDFTPTHVDIDSMSGDSITYSSGGGDKFLDFIENELIPYIDKTYPTSTYRTFVGHSFGGLSVINALVNRAYIFNNYVAIDPSLWWDNQAFLNEVDSILSVTNFKDKTFYVGVANTMESGMDIGKVQKDEVPITASTIHIKSILKFVNALDKKKDNELKFKWRYYKDDNHGSVPFITEYDAFRFIFSWYKLNNINDFFSPNSTLTSDDVVESLNTHYINISSHLGYEVIPPESLINSLGMGFVYNDMPDKALALLSMNIKNHPNSANVYKAMGDYYLFQLDTLNAIKNFKTAVKIDDDLQIKEKLEKLK